MKHTRITRPAWSIPQEAIELSDEDSWINIYSSTLGHDYGLMLWTIEHLPESIFKKRNETELRRYIDRIRQAKKAKNIDALEGWLNALAVGVKSAAFLLDLATEGVPIRQGRHLGGESRKGRLSDFNHALMRLAERLKTRDVDAILQEMRDDCTDDSDLLEDLRAHPTDPVRIRFVDVPDDPQDSDTIAFVVVRTGAEEVRSIKHLRNTIRKR